jgi:hypothetical protein
VDETTIMRPLPGTPSGPERATAEHPPVDFGGPLRRLDHGSDLIGQRLAARLQRAYELHDLDRGGVMTAQREIDRLAARDLLPSPNSYWETVAVPRANMLVDAARVAIDEESSALDDTLDRFLTASRRSTLEPWSSGPDGLTAIRRAGVAAAQRIPDAVPSSEAIEALGEWWQRRLRRAAIIKAVPQLLLPAGSTDAVIGAVELVLLDRPPWNFTDRLLSAFELAHSEVRYEAETAIERLHRRIEDRCGGPLTGDRNGRAFIELRQAEQ